MDKFICVGKNYLDHARELGDQVPDQPVLFLKPPSSGHYVANGEKTKVQVPKNRGLVHYECEIILLLDASAKIIAVSLGLDMTLRDVQLKLKKQGQPWEIAKVFPQSAVVGPWISIKDFPNYLDELFVFSLDGSVKQNAKGTEMRTSPKDCLSFAQDVFQIKDGDIMFTGTPAGVGPVIAGQTADITWGDKLHYSVLFE